MDAKTTQRIKDGMAYELGRKGPPKNFPPLPSVPASRYTEKDFYDLEMQKMWKRVWAYAAHMDQLPQKGSYLLWEKLESPILIVRGKDDKVRAFYNTCRHRGAPLVKEKSGKRNLFVCGYHGWSYDPEGNLIAVRDERDFPDFDKSCLGLISVRCEVFGNWIFINHDDNAEPLSDFISPIKEELLAFQPENLRLVEKSVWEVSCNVKVLLDAFQETYHLKSIHQQTVDRFLDHMGTTIDLLKNGHSRMVTPNRRPEWKDPGVAGLPEIETVGEIARDNNVSYNIYPNIVCPPAPTGMPFIMFWPKTMNTMVLECIWFGPDWGKGPRPKVWDARIENFERIIEEDTQFAPQIQKSVESDGFKGIPLSYQERRIYHWHEELDRRIGLNNVPDHSKVKQILNKYTISDDI
jgi:phenylpropionate dioxygenase-like ring-hydroxylating dioxygenase large terminal subunit